MKKNKVPMSLEEAIAADAKRFPGETTTETIRQRPDGKFEKVTTYPGGSMRIVPITWESPEEYVLWCIEAVEKGMFEVKGDKQKYIEVLKKVHSKLQEGNSF